MTWRELVAKIMENNWMDLNEEAVIRIIARGENESVLYTKNVPVRYARKAGVRIIIVFPDGSMKEESAKET